MNLDKLPAGVDLDAPASHDSFVLQKLQARLQELEADNEELQAHCADCNDLLTSMQGNLELTSASAEDAEARVRELELQLEDRTSTPKAEPSASSSNSSSGDDSSGFDTNSLLVRFGVLGLVSACELGAGSAGAWANHAAGAPCGSWGLGTQVLWTTPTLLGLFYAFATGSKAAVQAGCVPVLARHAAAIVSAWIFGVDLPMLGPCRRFSHAALHLFICVLMMFVCTIAADQPPETQASSGSEAAESSTQPGSGVPRRSPRSSSSKAQLHSAGANPPPSGAHFEQVVQGKDIAGLAQKGTIPRGPGGMSTIWDSDGSSPGNSPVRRRRDGADGSPTSPFLTREGSSGSDAASPQPSRESRSSSGRMGSPPTRRGRPRPEEFFIDEDG